MPFTAILKELVLEVEGAEGAIVIEADGEAVQWFAKRSDERLRLRAAYVALAAQGCRDLVTRLELTNRGVMLIKYEGANFVIAELESNYLIILELQSDANIGEAFFKIVTAANKLLAVL